MRITKALEEYCNQHKKRQIGSINLSADGTLLAIVLNSRGELYDLSTKVLLDSIPYRVQATVIRQDNEWIALHGEHATKLYHVPQRKVVKTLRTGHVFAPGIFYQNSYLYPAHFKELEENAPLSVTMHKDDSYIYGISLDNMQQEVWYCNRGNNAILQQITAHGDAIYLSFLVHADNRLVSELCRLLPANGEKPVKSCRLPLTGLGSLACSNRTGLAYFVTQEPGRGGDCVLYSYDIEKEEKKKLCRLEGMPEPTMLRCQGRYLYLSYAQTVRVVDLLNLANWQALSFPFLFWLFPCDNEGYVSVLVENGTLLHIESAEKTTQSKSAGG